MRICMDHWNIPTCHQQSQVGGGLKKKPSRNPGFESHLEPIFSSSMTKKKPECN